MANKTCLFFIPYAVPSHQVPMVETAKRLIEHSSSFSVTFLLLEPPFTDITSNIFDSYLQSVQSLNLPIYFQKLPSVEPPPDFGGFDDFIANYMLLHLPHVRSAVFSSSSRVVGFVLDLFATSLMDLAHELKIPSYIFFASNAAFLGLMLHLPTLDEKMKLGFYDADEVIHVPGLMPIPAHSVPEMLINKKSPLYTSLVYHGRRFMDTKGIVINSNIALEPLVLKAVGEGQCIPGRPAPELFPIGPIISVENRSQLEHECIKWLNKQPPKSVVFLCFGTRGAFEIPQLREIAKGLECSGHRFLWTIKQSGKGQRSPTKENLDDILLEGFKERTKEKGLVWTSWVPQSEILAHQSVGGFVTHCGWNSCLESLWFGVPMIPWPLYAEQSLNAFVMVNDMKVAVNLKLDVKNNGFVSANELERAVKCLMEDNEEVKKLRSKVEEIKSEFKRTVRDGQISL